MVGSKQQSYIPRNDTVRQGKNSGQKRDASFGTKKMGKMGIERDDMEQSVVDIARVTRVTKGGKRFSFRATVVVGNRNGKVGVGIGRGADVAGAIDKAVRGAKKKLLAVSLANGTIPYDIIVKYNSAVVLFRPAKRGTGIKAGGVVRVITKLAGIKDVSAKIIRRTNNKINIARATMKALHALQAGNPRSGQKASLPNKQ